MAKFDDLYRNVSDYFGAEPEELLVRFEHALAPAGRVLDAPGRVLDIGAGQGRNALRLARRGVAVDCIDPSETAEEQVWARVLHEDLPVRFFPQTFETFVPDVDYYDAVLAFGLIQELPRELIEILVERIGCWTRPGGLALVTAFTTADPGFEEISRAWRKIGSGSFSNGGGSIQTFLEAGELREIFVGWETLHYREGLGAAHRHGSGGPHRHVSVEGVFRRRRAD